MDIHSKEFTDDQERYLNSLNPHARSPSFYELLEIFPDAIPAARRALKQALKEVKASVSSLSDFREIYMNDINKMHFKQQPFWIAWVDEQTDSYREMYDKEIRKCKAQLDYLDRLENPEAYKDVRLDDINPERIARAKEYPIADLVELKRGHYCLCPFHDDRHPSMFVYKDNHAFCYSCNKKADAIDICMKLRHMDFREAVRTLAP